MVDQPAPRARRNLPDLSRLYDSLEETKISSLDLTRPGETAPAAGVRLVENTSDRSDSLSISLPPELQTYLPPDLWRKLNSETLRRGILVNALERLNSLLHTISTYLPGDLVQEKLRQPIPGLVNGKMLKGCLLFSDVSGFTALSERLAVLGPQGAEHLTKFINQYFTTMIDIISWSNGTLIKFAGDATLVYFPEQEDGAHVQWAARAGLRMLRAMKDFANLPTPLGPVTLSMKLGVSAGSFLAASLGSPKRMEYGLIGETVVQTLQAEGNSAPGLMVTNQLAADWLRSEYELSEVAPGFFLVKAPEAEVAALDEFEIRQTEKRRARSAVQWDTSLEEIAAQIETALHQLQALTPYLASELVDRIIAHAYQRQVQSEYRPTTVMFCNFTGPEALLEAWGEAGIQRVTGLLSAYFSDMNEVVTRFGGIVSRIDPYSHGTKLLALFGAPVAHEDDPQRAVNAALAMNSALQDLNRRWLVKLARHLPSESPANLIEHRIGITLGETFAGQAGSATRREYTVMGDEVNLSARLMSAARPGQILISGPVFERTNAYYVHSQLAPIKVKGKKKPIPIWQVDGPREGTLLNRMRNRAPLIGRASEMERAWQLLQLARAGAGCQLILTGPAGIGKSHLADALLNRALEADWQIQVFQCRSYLSQEAFSGWMGLLRSMAGITSLDHPLIQKEKLERLTAQLSLPTLQTKTLIDLLGLRQAQLTPESVATEVEFTGEQRRISRRARPLEEVFSQLDGLETQSVEAAAQASAQETTRRWQALAAVCSALAAQKPLVIFFEDAHWLDAASRDCLETLSRELTTQPVFFLLAARPQGAAFPTGEILQLKPFTSTETSAMVAAILTAGLTEIIQEQSNGSPLFVEEISRWIKRTHSIDAAGLKEVLQGSDILQKLVLSSLESLPESQREVARLASVSGVEFRRSEVEALLDGALDPVTLNAYLQNLTQAHLIAITEASVDARYTFVQATFREILYASLSFERRRELHARLAEHLQTLPSRRRQLRDKIAAVLDTEAAPSPIRNAEKLAYHYEMSEQWLAAVRQLLEVVGLLNPAESEALYTRALTLLEHYPPENPDPEIGWQKSRAFLGLGDLAFQRGDLPAAAAAYESAGAAAPKENLPAEFSRGLTARLVLILPSQGKIVLAEKQLAALLAQVPEADWKLQGLQAWLLWRAKREAAPAIAACQANLPENASADRQRLQAFLADLAGNWTTAAENYHQLGEFQGEALAYVRLGDQCLQQEKSTEAGQHYEAAAALWQTLASDCGLALVRYRQAELAWQTGHTARVLSLLETALLALDQAPPSLQPEPRACLQNALTRVKKNQPGPWEPWRWQPFEDLFRIRFFFPLFDQTTRNNP